MSRNDSQAGENIDGAVDAVIIAGDVPQEVLGKEARERMRLDVDGVPATLAFLRHYFGAGRDSQAALAALQKEPLPFVSLNGAYLRQFLEDRGFTTLLVPLFTRHRDRLVQALLRKPKAVVISTTFLPFARQIDAIAAFVKEHAPETTVIAGGVQVWKSYRHKLHLDAGLITRDIRDAVCEHNYLMDDTRPSPVDVLVVSARGEATLAALLCALRAGEDCRTLDNVAFFRDGRWRINRIVEEPYQEIEVDWTRHPFEPTGAYYPVQAGQGCGFRCTFCDFCGLFPRTRSRSARSVVGEIKTIPAVGGVRRAYFTDDNLFTDRSRAGELCREIISTNLVVKWRGMVRVSVVDERIADLMAESGCMEVLLGVESGDGDMLARMKKRTTPDEILAGVELLHRRGINTKSTFIIGFPGETEETVRNTVDILNAYPTDGPGVHRYMFFQFAVLPLAGVASAESRAAYGLRGYGYHWEHSTMSSEEAARQIVTAQEAVKPELSPSYVLEVPEMPGLSIEQLKRIYLLRNAIVRLRSGRPEAEPEDVLWAALEDCFSGVA